MATTKTKDGLFTSYDAEYWETYLAARPTYSPEFYELIFKYHAENGNNNWALAHDVGTGPGNVAAVLAERFEHVIATDASLDHVNAARQRYEQQADKISFSECKGEGLASAGLSPPRATDLVANAEAIPLMDSVEAVNCFAELLAPGGTCAVWFYGRPTFAGPDADTNEACQRIFYSISTQLLNNIGGMSGPLWERSTRTIASQLDNVAFPTTEWRKVARYKWNSDQPMLFHDESKFGGPVERVSRIGPSEDVITKTDPGFWQMQWGAAEVRRWFDAHLPTWYSDKAEDPELEGWYKDLERIMEGKSLPVAWPVVLILATRI